MAPVFNAKGNKAPFVKATLVKKIGYAFFKAFNLINVTLIKKTGCASFRASNLMNLIPIKKIGRASFGTFSIKNNILIKTTQLALATLKVTPAKIKRATAACLKKVN